MDDRNDLAELARNWSPPVELSRGTREVRLSASGIGLATLAAMMFLGAVAAGVGLSRLIARETAEETQLRETGIETQAVVTRHWRTGDKSDTPRIEYRFEHDGQIVHGAADTPLAIWRSLRVGSPISVRFVPGNPTLNHPTEWERHVTPRGVPGIVAATLVLVGLLIVWLIRRQMRLLSDGLPAPARVTGHVRVQHGQMLRYEFRTLDGAIVKGRGGQTRRPPPVGATVCVIYDRENPKRNAPYPLELVRVLR